MLRWLEEKLQQYLPSMALWSLWIGILLLVLSAGFAARSLAFSRSQVSAVGAVAENVAIVAPDGKTVYVTHVRFRLPTGGLIVTFVDPVVSAENDEPNFAAGTVVPVSYPHGNPKAARVATVWRVYFAAIVLGVLGVTIFDLGLIFRFILKRQIPRTRNHLKSA